MAAQPEATQTQEDTTQASGFTKVLNEARGQLEKIWNDAFSQINARYREAEKDVREFVAKLEADGKKRVATTLSSFPSSDKMKDFWTKVRPNDLVDQGVKLGEDAIEKLGLVRASELESLKGELDKLAKKLETVRKKANSGPTKKSVEAIDKRVKKLEKAKTK